VAPTFIASIRMLRLRSAARNAFQEDGLPIRCNDEVAGVSIQL